MWASTDLKVAQMILKELSERAEGKLTPIAELKLGTHFAYENKRHFILF